MDCKKSCIHVLDNFKSMLGVFLVRGIGIEVGVNGACVRVFSLE